MKKTFTAKITLSGTAVEAVTKGMAQGLFINALNAWFNPYSSLKDEVQVVSVHKVQVTAEEIDTE